MNEETIATTNETRPPTDNVIQSLPRPHVSAAFVREFPLDVTSQVECQEDLEASDAYRIMPPSLRYLSDLALDELASNTIKYGGATSGTIRYSVHFNGHRVRIVYEDNAMPFNPWNAPVAEIDPDDFDDMPDGGRGIFMLMNASHEHTYERKGGKNVVTLVRHLTAPTATEN